MSPVIKIDLDKVLNGPQPVVVELGCGPKKKNGRIGIDRVDLAEVDIVHNIEEGLSFFPDNSVHEIHCRSLLEHIKDFELVLKEMVRVLKPQGSAHIFVPHFSNPYYYSDYTHTRFFGLYTFYYFVEDVYQLKRKVPNFYTNFRIRIVSQKLKFRSSFKLLSPFKKGFGFFVNLHPAFQGFYEENLCYIVPCSGIEIIFRPDAGK